MAHVVSNRSDLTLCTSAVIDSVPILSSNQLFVRCRRRDGLMHCVSVLHMQEPDAARTQADDKSDPDFNVSKDEMRAADTAAAEEPGAGKAMHGCFKWATSCGSSPWHCRTLCLRLRF